MLSKPNEIASLKEHPDYETCAPTPDHFIPLLYIAGLAAAEDEAARTLIDGYAYGSISMTAYSLDSTCPTGSSTTPSASIPDIDVTPADETNI